MPTPLPPAAELRARFLRDGYAVLEDVFPPALLADCAAALDAHFAGQVAYQFAENFKPAACEVIAWNPYEAGVPAFVRLGHDPALRAAMASVLGDDYVWQNSLIMHSPPHSGGQAWHQDCPCADPAQFNVNCLIYATDVVPGSGDVVFVPGSHRRGELPVGEPHGDLPGQVVLAPKANTLLLLHGHTYHRVTPVGERARVSINYRVLPRGTPTDITNIGVYRNLKYRFSTREVVEVRMPGATAR